MTTPTWQGFLRADGRKGIRNTILVIYTVECAKHVAHEIGRGEDDVHVIGFPGCYDNEYAIRLMLALARHPNVGGMLAVGLGCEYTQPERLAMKVKESGRPADSFWIQESGGTLTSIEKGKASVRALRAKIDAEVPRVEMGLGDLIVGAECGGSDGTSGLAGNPVVGRFYDRLVDAGGSAIFEELVEMIGLKDMLVDRGSSDQARAEIGAAYDKTVAYCEAVQQYSISPGNFAGGLTTIEEKSMGAVAKGGSRPIEGIIRVSEPPRHPGLWILDSVPDPHFMGFGYTNPNDTEGIMDLISTGAQIVLFITGRGSVIGSPVSPLIKVTGNHETYRKMQGDMDFDASRVLTGELTMDQAAQELEDLIVATCRGQLTLPEQLGHREYFLMYKHQETPDLAAGCRA